MQKVTLFMAVPTIYAKLLEYFDAHYGSDEMNHAHGFLHSACKDKIRFPMTCHLGALSCPKFCGLRVSLSVMCLASG